MKQLLYLLDPIILLIIHNIIRSNYYYFKYLSDINTESNIFRRDAPHTKSYHHIVNTPWSDERVQSQDVRLISDLFFISYTRIYKNTCIYVYARCTIVNPRNTYTNTIQNPYTRQNPTGKFDHTNTIDRTLFITWPIVESLIIMPNYSPIMIFLWP